MDDNNHVENGNSVKEFITELAELAWIVGGAAFVFTVLGDPTDKVKTAGLAALWLLPAIFIKYFVWNHKFGARVKLKQAESSLKEYEEQIGKIKALPDVNTELKVLGDTALERISDFMREKIGPILKKGPLTEVERQEFVQEIIESMCFIFKDDAKHKDKYLPTAWVKATFFVYIPKKGNNFVLKREAYAYPATMSPKVEEFDSQEHKDSTAINAILRDEFYSFDDVKKRYDKHGRDFIPMYPGQLEIYKSIMCFPVFSGDKGAPSRRPLGVVTLDTNVLNYFPYYKEDMQTVAFYNALLSPLKQLIIHAYTLDDD